MGARMRALAVAVLVLMLAGASAARAADPPPPVLSFEHDGTRDGTPLEIHSGFYPGDPPSGDPLVARFANTYETFPVTVPDGTRHTSLDTTILWPSAGVNLDLYVYRLDAAGRPINPAVARSARTRTSSELAVYAPIGHPVEPGRYLVVVDNYCSRDADDDPRSTDPRVRANCGIGAEVPDEDDFTGTVRLGNQLPQVTLTGPDSVPAGEPAAFHAVADDPDGGIATYQYDLDGNGVYELDTDGNPDVSTTFPEQGTYTVGVQVIDDAGATAFATKTVTVTRAPSTASPPPPLTTFRLNRTSFGGRQGRVLQVTYRLRERARVKVTLYRGARRFRVIDAGVRQRRVYYRIDLKPAHLRPGLYTVKIDVQGASGRRQAAQLRARRY